MNTAASSDEKMLAALAHGSVFLMFLGPVVPVILWVTQRRKSKYVSFHALQAMGYQALYFWLWIIVWILVMVLLMCLMPVFMASLGSALDPETFPFFFQLPIFIIVFGFLGLFFVLGLAGAVACLLGHDFRYPVLGRWLERYLSYSSDPEPQMLESQEESWVAGICHATAILQLWGVVTPLIVWFSQKERSARLGFQAIQAAVYQLLAFVAYMLGMIVYMLVFFAMFFSIIVGGSMGGGELEGPPAFMMVLFLIVMLLFGFVMMIVMPVYYLLAGLGSVRVLRGHNFRYPLLGKIIEKRIAPSHSPEPVS